MAYSYKKNFKIIGSAHNLKEIRIKENQNVEKQQPQHSHPQIRIPKLNLEKMQEQFSDFPNENEKKHKKDCKNNFTPNFTIHAKPNYTNIHSKKQEQNLW